MSLKLSAAVGLIAAVLLVALGLWGWSAAPRLTAAVENGHRTLLAFRFGATAALGAAQVVAIGMVMDAFYPRDRLSTWLEMVAAMVCVTGLLGLLVVCSGQ